MFFKKESVVKEKYLVYLELIDPTVSAGFNLDIREQIYAFIEKNNLRQPNEE